MGNSKGKGSKGKALVVNLRGNGAPARVRGPVRVWVPMPVRPATLATHHNAHKGPVGRRNGMVRAGGRLLGYNPAVAVVVRLAAPHLPRGAARNPATAPLTVAGEAVSWYSAAAGAAGIVGAGGNPANRWAVRAVAKGLYSPTKATLGATNKRQAILQHLAGAPTGCPKLALALACGAGSAVLGAMVGNGHIALAGGVYTLTATGRAALAQ